MKRFFTLAAIIAATATAAHAQFTKGTKYIATSVSGLTMSYSKTSEFNLGLNAEGGYYFSDAWSAQAHFGYNHAKTLDGFTLGAGARYHFTQNGIFIGAGLEYAFDKFSTETTILPIYYDLLFDENGTPVIGTDGKQKTVMNPGDSYTKTSSEKVNNIRIPIEIGYTFYLNHYLAIEPAIYSKMSLNHFSDGTEFGLKVGLGFYFDRFHNVQKSQRRQPATSTWDF